MMELGKHLFIFAYIFSFIVGLVNVTLTQLLFIQTKNSKYKSLRFFNIAFLFHIIVNFIYFYRAYFVSIWEWKIIILTAVNLSTVIFICLGIFVLDQISDNIEEVLLKYEVHKKAFLIGSGIIYVITFSVVRSHHLNATVTFDDWFTAILFVGTNLIFSLTAIYCCLTEFKKAKKKIESNHKKHILYSITYVLLSYVTFNFLIDVYFGNITDKLLILNVNAYHLVVFAFIVLQIILIWTNMRELKSYSGIAQSDINCVEKIAEEKGLTYREKELIALVYEGCTNQEIAEKLFISENTVKRHMTNIYKKIGVVGRVDLIKLIGANSQNG